MLVVTWNIQGIKGLPSKRLGPIIAALEPAKPDILLLQEVGVGRAAEDLSEGLTRIGLPNQFYSGNIKAPKGQAKRKDYGNVIASKWPLTGDRRKWARGAPWPQLLARATVETPGGPVDVYAAHIPNG